MTAKSGVGNPEQVFLQRGSYDNDDNVIGDDDNDDTDDHGILMMMMMMIGSIQIIP